MFAAGFVCGFVAFAIVLTLVAWASWYEFEETVRQLRRPNEE